MDNFFLQLVNSGKQFPCKDWATMTKPAHSIANLMVEGTKCPSAYCHNSNGQVMMSSTTKPLLQQETSEHPVARLRESTILQECQVINV